MTIEELLGLPADDLDKIPFAELAAFFEPYLQHTRPERVVKETANKHVKKNSKFSDDDNKKLQMALKMAREHGIEI